MVVVLVTVLPSWRDGNMLLSGAANFSPKESSFSFFADNPNEVDTEFKRILAELYASDWISWWMPIDLSDKSLIFKLEGAQNGSFPARYYESYGPY